jgi:hypothetical protein
LVGSTTSRRCGRRWHTWRAKPGQRFHPTSHWPADDATLAEIARRIGNRVKEQPNDAGDRAKLGWMLNSACLEQLAAMRTAEQLPPELAAALSVHAGEAGRRSSSLDELARAGSQEAFVARVTAENLSYLEDASPSAVCGRSTG